MFYSNKTQLRFSKANVPVESSSALGYILSINSKTEADGNLITVTTKIPGEYDSFKPTLEKLVDSIQKDSYFWIYDSSAQQYIATLLGVKTVSDLPSNRFIDNLIITFKVKPVA